MANTNFVDQNTVILSSWLNDVNKVVYVALGDGTNAPLTQTAVKTNLAINNVDNTSDLNKPISTATQTAIDNLSASTTAGLATKADAATTTPRTSTTGSSLIPTGTTAQRDGTPSAGYFRFNSTLGKFEGYNGSAWGAVGGGATGGGSDAIFLENGKTVTANYTITTNNNAGSFGPITINSGVTVTVPTGSVWTVV